MLSSILFLSYALDCGGVEKYINKIISKITFLSSVTSSPQKEQAVSGNFAISLQICRCRQKSCPDAVFLAFLLRPFDRLGHVTVEAVFPQFLQQSRAVQVFQGLVRDVGEQQGRARLAGSLALVRIFPCPA
ncbi:hypothetical protein M7784_10095 [Desulfovibrio aminophilus]|nr:hypothetical protein [Desulfovibrio aminophilus]MCM0755594.1 hypothetical protein [Desulfovibrio aminophilus]